MRPIHALRLSVAVIAAVFAVAGCGGSSGPDSSVNGCDIQPSTSCPNADLSAADLSNADLSQADLSGANLGGTNLEGANLTQANLSNARIVDANLSNTNLTSANLTGATITGTSFDDATLCGTTRTDGTTDDSSCPATGGTTTETTTSESTETTTTTAAAAEVTSFDVGDLTCGAATTAPVQVQWETENATAVDIAVDSFTPAGYGPSGTATVTVPCDGESHDVTITPRSDTGPGEPETKTVSS